MSNKHPHDPAQEVPSQHYQSSNKRSVADSHSHSLNEPRAPHQVPGETKPDPNPPPDWPTRPKQSSHPAVTGHTGPLHDSPSDKPFAYEHLPTAITPSPHERAYPAHTTQHGNTESNPQSGAGYIGQQPVAQSPSASGSMTASWSSHQSSSATSSSNSGRDTSSKYGRRDDDNRGSRMGQAQEAIAPQDSAWIWSPKQGKYYRWSTNAQGVREVVWG